MLGGMVLLAVSQGLLCVAAPDQVVRVFSLLACSGATVYAACLILRAGRR